MQVEVLPHLSNFVGRNDFKNLHTLNGSNHNSQLLQSPDMILTVSRGTSHLVICYIAQRRH